MGKYISAGNRTTAPIYPKMPSVNQRTQPSAAPKTEPKIPKEKAPQTKEQWDVQTVTDMENMINRFEKKIHDLKMTRIISIQMAPQIRLLQNNESELVEKIQSSLTNTIPLWKNQIVLALGISNSKQALDAQHALSNATNELLQCGQ